jgi:hypothetical protein
LFQISTFFKAGFLHPQYLFKKMRHFSILFALAVPLLASAAPARFLGKRAAADILVFRKFLYTVFCSLSKNSRDISLTEFADVLEQLESTFYQQGLSKFKDTDFTAAGFSSSQIAIEQLTSIQADEATHSKVLQVRCYYAPSLCGLTYVRLFSLL